MAPIKLRSNEYWGKRSGSVTRDGQFIIKGKRASQSSKGSGAGAGRAERRRNRTYANRKLSRPSRAGVATSRGRARKAA